MSTFTVRPLGYALGAEITGLDLRHPIDRETIAEVRKVWLDHVVVCFRGEVLTAGQLQAFCSNFGELNTHPIESTHHPDNPQVIVVVNQPVILNGKSFRGGIGDEWHTDQQYTVKPPAASFLHAQILPDVGGNTMFSNQYRAYETLSPAMRRVLDGLEAVHDVSVGEFFSRYPAQKQAEIVAENPPAIHKVVRVHPETGRKALYIGSRVRNFVGMNEEETRPLVAFLNRHATSYENTYRHAWQLGDVVVWDNRCAMHRAVADYDRGQLRRMIRCELLAPPSGRPREAVASLN